MKISPLVSRLFEFDVILSRRAGPFSDDDLDEEDEDDEAEATSGRRKKKPYRYRWPAEVHDEVLARLLDLNQKRAEEERLSGAAAEAAKKRTAPAKKAPAKAPAKTRAPAKKKTAPEGPLSLFGDDKETE